MAKVVVVSNWKSHPESFLAAKNLIAGLKKSAHVYKKVAFFIAPPFPYFETVKEKGKSFSSLASQDIFSTDGTYTGAVTPQILKGFGVKLAIIGHSERRALGETNELVAKKVMTALKAGIVPLVCVGEKSRDTEGNHFEFLREQLKGSLQGLRRKEDIQKLVIAYEPVWAIGKQAKNALSGVDLSQMSIFIKKILTDMFGRELAEKIVILYGGSVEASNARSLLKEGKVRGFLVGHASLEPKGFGELVKSLI
jgi:triosephosphate isomerase (TIM)